MPPTVNLDALNDHLKTISYDDFELFWVVKQWIINNIMERPTDDYVNSIVGALVDENMV